MLEAPATPPLPLQPQSSEEARRPLACAVQRERRISCARFPVRQQSTEVKTIKYVVPIARLIGTAKPFLL